MCVFFLVCFFLQKRKNKNFKGKHWIVIFFTVNLSFTVHHFTYPPPPACLFLSLSISLSLSGARARAHVCVCVCIGKRGIGGGGGYGGKRVNNIIIVVNLVSPNCVFPFLSPSQHVVITFVGLPLFTVVSLYAWVCSKCLHKHHKQQQQIINTS